MILHTLTPLRALFATYRGRFRKIVRSLTKQSVSPRTDTQTPNKGGVYKTCIIPDSMVDPCKVEPSVVIIGAGIAGLSVAQRLVQSGISKITILEATERPGGRIHSCWLNDVVAEMGCQWIYGASMGNPVYNLAAQEGLLKPPLKRSDFSSGLFCTSDGRAVDHTVALMAYHCFGTITSEAHKLFTSGCGKEHGSLLNYMSLRIHQELLKFPEEMRYDAARIMYGQTNRLKFLMGDDLSKVSADNFGSYIQIPGGSVQIPLGFVGVLSPLLKELPDCSVKFGKPVTLIKWGAVQRRNKGEPRAVVQCSDGEEHCADYVVITVSLGVLKEHAEKMFCPSLPADKMIAIKSLGFGNVDKIFLDYNKPFWVWSEGGIKFAWSPDELAQRTDWTKGLVSVEEVPDSKHVLCAYIAGPESIVMEQASDEEVAERITKVLRQFTGDPSLPYPSTILRTKWASDPYFCGSYSYINVDSNVGHICDLSCPVPGSCDPIPPILMFAGEATCAGHHSSVHGARLSGVREAERIIQLTKKFGGPPPK